MDALVRVSCRRSQAAYRVLHERHATLKDVLSAKQQTAHALQLRFERQVEGLQGNVEQEKKQAAKLEVELKVGVPRPALPSCAAECLPLSNFSSS